MFKKYFKKSNLKTIGKVGVVAAAIITGVVALVYAISNFCYYIYNIADETLTIRKQLTKLNMAHKIDLKKKYNINIDTFMEEYESKLKEKMLNESNDEDEIINDDEDIEEDFVCED